MVKMDMYEAHAQAVLKGQELKRIGKALKDKRFTLIVMNAHLHQDDTADDSIKLKLKNAEDQYQARVKKIQDDTESVENAIELYNKKYDALVEKKRNDIQSYQLKKEQEIEELEALRTITIKKQSNKLEDLEKQSSAQYQWDQIQLFSSKLNGTKRKSMAHVRAEMEVQVYEEQYNDTKQSILDLNNIVNPDPTPAKPKRTVIVQPPPKALQESRNVLVRTSPVQSVVSSIDDISVIGSEELNQLDAEVNEMEKLRNEARAADRAEREELETKKAAKQQFINEHNETVRIRVVELQAIEDKQIYGSKEHQRARANRQVAECDKI